MASSIIATTLEKDRSSVAAGLTAPKPRVKTWLTLPEAVESLFGAADLSPIERKPLAVANVATQSMMVKIQ